MTVVELVERERASLRRLHFIAGIAAAIAASGALIAIGAVLLAGSRWLSLPRALPVLLWIAIVAANLALLALTRRRIRRQTSLAEVTACLERERSLRAGSVRGVMEVANHGALGQRAAERLATQLGGSGALLPGARAGARRRLLQVAAMAAVAVVSLGALAPSFGDGLRAVARPVDAWRGRLLAPLSLVGLPAAVVRGEPLTLHIAAPGRRTVTLEERLTGEGWHDRTVAIDRAGTATLDMGPMGGDLHLAVTDGRTATDTLVVRVTDRPFVGGVALRAVYPAYLEREAAGMPIGELARVPAGTIIEVSGQASTNLHDVTLISERDSAPLTPTGHSFRGRLRPVRSGAWRWSATGASGAVSDLPAPLEFEVIPDSAPRPEILTPAHDTLVGAADHVTLRLTALDDHGLASVDIVSWTDADSTTGRAVNRLATAPGSVWGTVVDLDVARRGLTAGQALHVQLVATDNSPMAQRGESGIVTVRVATAEEQRQIARAAGDSAVAAAQAAVAAEKALERRTNEATQDRTAKSSNDGTPSGSNSMNFEAAQRAKALAQDQKALTDQVRQLAQTAKALEEQLRQAGALDSGLARQLQDAQAMLRDALTPELMKQLDKINGAAQQLSKDDAQQSLQDLKTQQQRLREQLEKSAEMLRRAAMEGAMQTLTDEARDLAKQQRALADSAQSAAAKPDSPASQNRTAQQLADRSGRLADQMKKLGQRLETDKAQTGAAKTDEARQHAEASEQQMRDAMPKKENPTAVSSPMEQAARDAASQMERSASAMQSARDSQVQEWKHELTSALDQSIQEMLQMSREESSLQQQMKAGDAKPEDARGQQSALKQGLDEAAQRLAREAQKSSLLSSRSQRAVSDAQQKVDQATQLTADPKNGSQASSQMSDAADALNRAAASLARDRERANTASSATGFAEMIKEMQDMAGKQGGINSQAQSLLPQPGSTPSPQAQAQARALAREQRQVADQLDELGDGAGGDKAARMAQEARQLAEQLDGSRIDATTLARQQQLFRKMLDAGRSLEKDEREDSDKREATAGNDLHRFTPENGAASGKAASKYREPTWDELRGLSAEERRVILEYFKKLNGRGG